MIRAVIDTNILVSALLQPNGAPAQVLLLCVSESIQICVSGSVFAEYEEVIRRPKFRLDENLIVAILQLIREKALWVRPVEGIRACSDPKDDIFLQCAHTAKAEFVVTGNTKHFPAEYAAIRVITCRQLLETVTLEASGGVRF